MPRDYHPVLVRATSGLQPDDEAARRAVYDRARLAIMDAGLTPAQTHDERAALEAAIARLEDEMRSGGPQDIRPRVDRRSAAPMAPAETASLGPRPRRFVLFGGLACLAVLAAMYAVWPRPNAPDGDAKQSAAVAPSPAAPRAAEGSGDTGLSYVLRRQIVYYRTVHPIGTIVIAKSQHNLYLVRPNVAAVRYTIGIGRGCQNAVGLLAVSDKRQAGAAPRAGASGDAQTRSGDLSLALGDTGLRIDGTEPPIKDGEQGCFTLANEDMADLFERASANARVVIN